MAAPTDKPTKWFRCGSTVCQANCFSVVATTTSTRAQRTDAATAHKKLLNAEGKTCSGCMYMSYCDRACQARHWPEHRLRCAQYRLIGPPRMRRCKVLYRFLMDSIECTTALLKHVKQQSEQPVALVSVDRVYQWCAEHEQSAPFQTVPLKSVESSGAPHSKAAPSAERKDADDPKDAFDSLLSRIAEPLPDAQLRQAIVQSCQWLSLLQLRDITPSDHFVYVRSRFRQRVSEQFDSVIVAIAVSVSPNKHWTACQSPPRKDIDVIDSFVRSGVVM